MLFDSIAHTLIPSLPTSRRHARGNGSGCNRTQAFRAIALLTVRGKGLQRALPRGGAELCQLKVLPLCGGCHFCACKVTSKRPYRQKTLVLDGLNNPLWLDNGHRVPAVGRVGDTELLGENAPCALKLFHFGSGEVRGDDVGDH